MDTKNDSSKEEIKMPFMIRSILWIEKKSGLDKLMNKYEKPIGRFIENHFTKILRIVEIGGTGVAGYSLGKFIYASTPQERGSALLTGLVSSYIALSSSLLDVLDSYTKKCIKRNKDKRDKNITDIIEEI